jgi:predicted acetyltransferase
VALISFKVVGRQEYNNVIGNRLNNNISGVLSMKVILQELKPQVTQVLFDMILEIDAGENGFVNSLKANDHDEFMKLLIKNYEYSKGINLPNNIVPQTIYWLYIDNKPVGYGKLRDYLNDQLKDHGGHIGYTIRPSERAKGYGKFILRELIKEAKLKNIEEVLLTCNESNIPSRRVIEHNKGQLIQNLNGRCKYIIKTETTDLV